jgi:hypothetical protein
MFLSTTKERILRLFFDNPGLLIHQRGISRRANVFPHSVNKYLKEFVRDGLLIRSEISQLTLFRINPKNDFLFKTFELFELQRKEELFEQNEKISRLLRQYSENLIRFSKRDVQMIILLRSEALERGTKKSPFEVLSVTSATVDKDRIIKIQEKEAQRMSHILEISPVHITLDKFIDAIQKKLELYEKLWKDRIVLYNEFLFWQSIREAKF